MFANEAVAKMEKIKVVKRVKKEECRFINPLTVVVTEKALHRFVKKFEQVCKDQ